MFKYHVRYRLPWNHWTATEIETQLGRVARAGERPATGYVIGGGAMLIHGFRERAPDIDIVVDSGDELRHLHQAITAAGFKSFRGMAADGEATFRGMYHDEELRDIDLWSDELEDKLDVRLTTGLIERSQSIVEDESIEFRVLSPEDLIVSKSLGERPRICPTFGTPRNRPR